MLETLRSPVRGRAPRRSFHIRTGFFAGAILWLCALSSVAQDKSGVSPSAISLPSGPGSIEGLGASFEPQLNTGTAAQSFSVMLPPGVAGHQPTITFSYDGGAGNGPLGLGWSGGVQEITRQTDKGAPKYTGPNVDPSSEDTFLFGGEELVPLTDGTYRCENESQFVRFRKVAAVEGGPVVGWEGTERNGNRMLFGLVSGQRVTRAGGNPDSFADTYCWKLASRVDVSGNAIDYSYESFAPESTGTLYCTLVEYARFRNDIHHRIIFTYSGSTAYPESRTDVFSDYRPGFEVRTSKLMREIGVFTDGNLVRRYVLDYEPDPSLVISAPGDVPLGFSLLQKITQFDRSGINQNYLPPLRMAYSRFHTQSVSPKEFRRAGFSSAKGLNRPEFLPATGGANFLRFGASLTEVVDINSDGLPDFVSSGENRWFAYLNKGEGTFSGEVLFQQSDADGKRIDEAGLTLADLDGDGVTDLFQKSAAGDRFLMHRNLNGFAEPTTLDETEMVRWGVESIFSDETGSAAFASLNISDPQLQRIDLNFDKRIDAMRPFDSGGGAGGVEYLFNLPGSDVVSAVWTSETLFNGDPRLPADWVPDEARFHGHNPALRRAGLADMNGDRLQDWYTLAIVGGEVWIDYWPNSNGGAWASRRSMERLELPDVLADDLLVLDVNSDGLNDLVRVENNLLTFWVNIGVDQWSAAILRNDAPPFIKNQTVLRQIDVNGNGTTDLFWDNSALQGKGEEKGFSTFTYFDFVGDLKPNLLQVIDNGIGVRTLIEYRSSADYYLAALESGHPWTLKLPFPVDVVSRVTQTVGLDLNGDGEADEYLTDFSYFDGYYDTFEKEFRGFAYAEEIERGDDYDPATGITTPAPGSVHAPTGVKRHRFLTGSPDGADNDDYKEGYAGPQATDEGSGTGLPFNPGLIDKGGREEEPLKGNPTMVEVLDPAALVAPVYESAGFFACARASALAARTDPFGLDAQRCAPDKYVYTRSLSNWKIRRLYRPGTLNNPPGRFADGDDAVPVTALVGKSVNFAFMQTSDQEIHEANGYLRGVFDGAPVPYPLRNRVLTRTFEDYDDFGNQILEADYGVIDPSLPEGLSHGNDERIMRTTYALGGEALDRWIVSCPSRVRVEDENGVFGSESRSYYDGPEFQGLPSGEIGSRGLLKKTENVVTDDPAALAPLEEYEPDRIDRPGDPRLPAGASIISSRVAHDVYGNVIAKVDPLGDPADVELAPDPSTPLSAFPKPGAKGHFSVVAFDEARRVHPVAERFVVGGDAEDLITTAVYDPGFGVVTGMTDFNGHSTTYDYDSFARLVKIIEPGDSADKPTTHYLYRPGDSQRNLVYAYDDLGNLLAGAPQTAPPPVANAVESRQRENVSNSPEYGVLVSISYTSGKSQALMQVSEDEVEGRWFVEQATAYNSRGSDAATYQAYSRANSDYHTVGEGGIRHDGNPITSSDRTEKFRDPLGRPLSTLNPPETAGGERLGGITQYLPLETRYFDEEDARPASVHFDTPAVELEDGLGRVVAALETARLNDDGTPSSQRKEWITRYSIDLNDQITAIEDSQNNVRWFRYDGLGRMIFMNDCNRGVLINTFDNASNMVERVDAKAQRTTYTYDGINRILTEDYHDEGQPFSSNRFFDPSMPLSQSNLPDVRYIYDTPEGPVDFGDGSFGLGLNTMGDLAAVIDLAGEEHFSYDDRGRRTSFVKRIPDPIIGDLVSFKTEMSFDAFGRLRELVYPDGDRILYEYNCRGLLERVVGGEQLNSGGVSSIIQSVDYIPSGQVLSQRYGNDIVCRYEYDPRVRTSALDTFRAHQPDTPILSYDYSYDGLSNLLRIADMRPEGSKPSGNSLRNTQIFAYDNLYRLTHADYSFSAPDMPMTQDAEVRYRYDRIGNMLLKTSTQKESLKGFPVSDLGVMVYGGTLGTSGRIGRASSDPGPHAVSTTANGGEIVYDANGNITHFGEVELTWDFVDRLVAAEDGSMRAEYRYDYTDSRILKKVFSKENAGTGFETLEDFALYASPHYEIRTGDQTVKYITQGNTILARVTGTLDPGRPRVQRFRIHNGWNFLTLLLNTPNFTDQIGLGAHPFVQSLYKWDPDSRVFLNLEPGADTVPGEVFSLLASGDAVLSVAGLYPGPSDRVIPTGVSFVPSTGLEGISLPEDLPAEISNVWSYDAAKGRWRAHYEGEIRPLSNLPPFLSPSEALFIQTPQVSTLFAPSTTESVEYYHPDHLGSSNATTDGNAELVDETAYFPFGHPRAEAARDLKGSKAKGQYLFTQKELDEETALQYFEARYLSGPLSRFISVDPRNDARSLGENPQILNPYAYAANNPLKNLDPNGQTIEVEGTPAYRTTVKQTLATLAAKSPDAKKLIQGLVNDKKHTVTIAYGGESDDRYTTVSRSEGRVYWDPTSALEFEKQGIQNGKVETVTYKQHSALGLAHELGHADGWRQDPDAFLKRISPNPFSRADKWIMKSGFDDWEEARVIVQVEGPIAAQLGLPVRTHHEGTPFKSKGPFSLSKKPPPAPPKPQKPVGTKPAGKPARPKGGVLKPAASNKRPAAVSTPVKGRGAKK